MLVITRRTDERTIIIGPGGEQLSVLVVCCRDGRVRLGFEGPREFLVLREELMPSWLAKGGPATAKIPIETTYRAEPEPLKGEPWPDELGGEG
jgi:carbon storage regulator CsrA